MLLRGGSKYWFPGFGFDSGPNLQPCQWLGGVNISSFRCPDFFFGGGTGTLRVKIDGYSS